MTASLRAALPFAAFYGAVFLALGIFLPFWPVFLQHRGLSGAEIGVVLALGTWIKTAVNPLTGQLADRSGRRRLVLTGLAGFALLTTSGFHLAGGFWAILVLHLLAFASFQAMIPLGESQAMAAVSARGLDYGRLRLWGSLTFIVAVLGVGELLTARSPELLLWAIMAAFVLLLAVIPSLPAVKRPEDQHARAPLGALATQPRFLLFLVVGALLQSSHAAYYALSAVHWKAAGLSTATVGWLWAEGVIAEVLLFAVGGVAVAKLGPVGLLVLAAVAGIVRWSVLGATTMLPALVGVQALHAFTFGAAHLGAMYFIAKSAPAGLHSTAQGVYAAVSGGLGMGLALLAAGAVYDAAAGAAFHAMAVMSLVAGLLALPPLRASREERSPPR